MTVQLADIATAAALDRSISDEELHSLRRAGWTDGRVSRKEAEAVFAAQRALAAPSPAWCDFFVEAICEYVLNGTEPRGHASEQEAGWLIAQISHDGRTCSMAELELLVAITEKGHNVPRALKQFVLREIEQAVLTGTGPTRDGGQLADTHVTEAECRLLRRTIFGPASERPGAVGRREAEMLFRLKDATQHAANAPDFRRVFVQGVGNYLMGFASESAQLSHARMLELEGFVANNQRSIAGFMGRMAKDAPAAFGMVFGRRDKASPRDERVAAAHEITGEEQEWLDRRIAANGGVDDYDMSLLEFIAEEAGRA